MVELKVDIALSQLVELIRQLPARERRRLLSLFKEGGLAKPKTDKEKFSELLRSGPTFSKAQIKRMEETRAAISKWRDT
jgi:hypothetical protein